ncbi:hypothetical protein BDW22DRAFT_1298369, partial [Trametopsis cervina]
SSTAATATSPRQKCRIAEILLYDCDADNDKGQFHCWPVMRIFRICPGRPAIEITRYVDFNESTGGVKLTPESQRFLPKGKPWRDVHRY